MSSVVENSIKVTGNGQIFLCYYKHEGFLIKKLTHVLEEYLFLDLAYEFVLKTTFFHSENWEQSYKWSQRKTDQKTTPVV